MLALALGACGGGRSATAPGQIAVPIGKGAPYRPPSLGAAARAAAAIDGMRCSRGEPRRYGVHVELFAGARVVIVPAGIGVAPPRRERGAYVTGGRCSYPVATREPTGVVLVTRGAHPTLANLFDVWGQPLTATALASFDAPPGARVRAYVGGRATRAEPRTIPLARHAEIVLEVGAFVPPHASYRFPPGL